MDSVLCLTEFTLHLCNVPFRRKLYGRETGTNMSFKMGGEKHARLFKFQQQVFVLFYDVLKRSCLFLIVLEMLTICLYMLFLEPFMYTIYFIITTSLCTNLWLQIPCTRSSHTPHISSTFQSEAYLKCSITPAVVLFYGNCLKDR